MSKRKSKSKEKTFLELINGVDIDNPVMNFDRYGNNIFWFDDEGKYICHYDVENETFWLGYERIWSVFENEYNLTFYEIKSFMGSMIRQHFKKNPVDRFNVGMTYFMKLEQDFKANGVIPVTRKNRFIDWMKRQLKSMKN